MKKLIIFSLIAVLFSACAAIQNPVNTNQLAAVEASYGVALSIAVAYRSLPLCKKDQHASVTNVCAERAVIVKMQDADRKVQGALIAARNFVRNNPTLNAVSVISAAQQAVDDFKTIQNTYGVN